jgi:hypothetical protein
MRQPTNRMAFIAIILVIFIGVALTNSQLANDDLSLQLVTAGGPASGL